MNDHRKYHLTAAKRIIIYIKGTIKLGFLFPIENKESKVGLIAILIQIVVEIDVIGEALMAMFSCSTMLQSPGTPRSN